MLTNIIYMVIGFIAGVVLFLFFRKSKKEQNKLKTKIHSSIEELRSVGELIVFKVITKEIVTADEHWLGEWGKKYLKWILSTKKMAMIFEFNIDFRYDLRSPDFLIKEEGEGKYFLTMPKCFYETHIIDIHFYDEQNAKLLPWLLPDLLNRAFGLGFDEEDKNRLKEEAKHQAATLAKNLVQKMRSEVQNSARQTLELLSKSFGAQQININFENADLVQLKVDTEKEKVTA